MKITSPKPGEVVRRRLNTFSTSVASNARVAAARAAGVATSRRRLETVIARRFFSDQWLVLLVLAPVAVAGPSLAAVDLDVQRLPDRVVLPLSGWVGVAAVTATAVTLDGALLIRAVVGGMVCLAGFGALRILSRGHFGFGDVKLSALLGACAGTVSWSTGWWALMLGCVAALLWALVRRSATAGFALGPWLLLGVLAAVSGGVAFPR